MLYMDRHYAYQRGLVPTEAIVTYHRLQHIFSGMSQFHIGVSSLCHFDTCQTKRLSMKLREALNKITALL
jgi:hypothetical protein